MAQIGDKKKVHNVPLPIKVPPVPLPEKVPQREKVPVKT